jgi:hypothetical protein
MRKCFGAAARKARTKKRGFNSPKISESNPRRHLRSESPV